jgi:Type IV secretion system pilin/Family of unknown function (DUF6112)
MTIKLALKTVSTGGIIALLTATNNTLAVELDPRSALGPNVTSKLLGARPDDVNSAATSISNLIQTVGNVLTFLIVAISVLFIILGAFQWMSGSEDNGKKTVRNALFGMVVALAAFLIAQGVAYTASAFLK